MSIKFEDDIDGNRPVGTKPYIIRAIYQWSLDNGHTPQILVDADSPDVVVPSEYIQNSRIILNLHPRSVMQLEISNNEISFAARFSGKSFQVFLPVASVMAIYGRENGQGVMFSEEPETIQTHEFERDIDKESKDGANNHSSETKPPHLKLVK